MKFIQIVLGPAGVGKSTYCKLMQEHGRTTKRTIHVANLDPAAETFEYDAAFDIRDFISVDAVMKDTGMGPNGALVYCMEYFIDNSFWLQDQLNHFGEEDYVLFDVPGQIELYSHLPVMKHLAAMLSSWGYRVASVYLMDALFIFDPPKFIAGCMLSLSAMIQLELPHLNIITKCDLANKEDIEKVLDSESPSMVINDYDKQSNPKLRALSQAIGSVIDDYMIVSFTMLDSTDEESIDEVLAKTDFLIQYGKFSLLTSLLLMV
jgi:GTPase SAR1 family protein